MISSKRTPLDRRNIMERLRLTFIEIFFTTIVIVLIIRWFSIFFKLDICLQLI